MVDVYHATVDDFVWVALQSSFYFNYLRDGPPKTSPSKSKLQLRLESKSENSRRVVKLLNNVAVKAGLTHKDPTFGRKDYFWLCQAEVGFTF